MKQELNMVKKIGLVGIRVVSSAPSDLQMPRVLHHILHLLLLDSDDLSFVQPVHDSVRVLEIFWWLFPLSVCDLYESPLLAIRLKRIDLITQGVK